MTRKVEFLVLGETARVAHPRMFDGLKLRKRVLEVEETVSTTQKELRKLQVEWMDTLDRLKTMMGRLLKERQTTQRLRAEMEPEEQSDETPAQGAGMSTRQQEINAQILARRNRLRGGTTQ